MPCDSSHMEANPLEIQMSQVYQLLDIIEGKREEVHSASWQGYDTRVYNVHLTKNDRDKLVAKLCTACQSLGPKKLKRLPLELQMWWRDHQKADREKELKEIEQKRNEKLKKQALKKLTAKERKALGL